MTRHTARGVTFSVWQDDGFGALTRVSLAQIIARIKSGWPL